MAQTQVILLERVGKLGQMGDTVTVKAGYARNYLLPEGKALRATKNNIAYFDAQKKQLESDNAKRKKDAEAIAKKLEGLKVPLIRQASEAGQLFGSVTARDIAKEVAEASKQDIGKTMVKLNQNYKNIGLFPVEIAVHAEVSVDVTINIARSPEEAEIQAKTGKALIAEAEQAEEAKEAKEEETNLEEVLEEGALEAEKEKQAAEAEAEIEAKAKEEAAAAKAAEKAAKKAQEEAAAAEAEESTAPQAEKAEEKSEDASDAEEEKED